MKYTEHGEDGGKIHLKAKFKLLSFFLLVFLGNTALK